MKHITIHANVVRQIFDYDADSGHLTWRRQDDKSPAWNRKYVGRVAGAVRKDGYVQVYVNARLVLAHRVAWAHMNGDLLDDVFIDHVNGNPGDNRLCNLRLATPTQNQWNRASTAGRCLPKGVDFYKPRKMFRARIRVNGKQKLIGLFADSDSAANAYRNAVVQVHGRFGRV